MTKYKITTTALAAAFCATQLQAVSVEVQSFRDGNIPLGYVDVSDGVDPGESINVSQDPFVDYLIPNNSGSVGIAAQKETGAYITESTVGALSGGANKLTNPDLYHVVFEWEDGFPLPFGSEHYGVSWGGWNNTAVETLTTRINLATDQPIRVYHWFNDGWDYSNHTVLDGHNLTVTHYNAGGSVIDEVLTVLPSGGAEAIFGDHRQFYTAIIDVTRTAEGDYVVITNEGGNVGYKGTAVSLEGGPVDPEPFVLDVIGDWKEYTDPPLGNIYGYSAEWGRSDYLGDIDVSTFPSLYQTRFGWITHVQGGSDAMWLFSADPQVGWIYTSAAYKGWFAHLPEGATEFQWNNFFAPQ